jgi:hypothetical protein
MLVQADRAAECQRAKLEKPQHQVKDSSLWIRKLTPEVRRRDAAVPVKARRK